MKKSAPFLSFVLALASFSLLSCGGGLKITKPPSGLTQRVMASQSASSPTAAPGLFIINGSNDTIGRGGISAGNSPGLMVTDPQRSVLLAFDGAVNSNRVGIVNTRTERLTGNVQLPGPTTSMVAPNSSVAYAAVPSALLNGFPLGAVVAMSLTNAQVTATISVPNAQTVVSDANGAQLLVFSNDSDSVTVVSPLVLNLGIPVSVTVPGFDRPVGGFFSGGNAYILNCGLECGGKQASVQILNLGTTPPTAGAAVPVDGATVGFLSGSTLYVAGVSPTNNLCTGQTTAAPTCGRLNIVDIGSLTVTGSAVITDGYHDRIDMGLGGQLFIGSHGCTTVGNVNSPQGEVRGCLSIYNTTNGNVIIPPDNGDVTGLQSFTSRNVEYVAEGGRLRVYDTTKDSLLLTSFISNGTIIITGAVIDVKAVDFF